MARAAWKRGNERKKGKSHCLGVAVDMRRKLVVLHVLFVSRHQRRTS